MTHFDAYGELAKQDVEQACQNGRYAIQGEAEMHIPKDVIAKLRIKKTDSVLDVGCGLGLNLGPMARIAAQATGIDHPNVIEKTKDRISAKNITFMGDDFLSADIDERFEKILAYSVLPALPNMDVLFKFIDKALSLLHPTGRALFGDLSNLDKKNRFIESDRGKEFLEEWNKNYAAQSNDQNLSAFANAGPAVELNDEKILEIIKYIRAKGFHAYLLDQPQNLPFGNSREDILVVGPENRDRNE